MWHSEQTEHRAVMEVHQMVNLTLQPRDLQRCRAGARGSLREAWRGWLSCFRERSAVRGGERDARRDARCGPMWATCDLVAILCRLSGERDVAGGVGVTGCAS